MRKAIMFRVKMDEVERRLGNITGKQLAEITGMREADISEINKRTTLNREKLCTLATIAGMDLSERIDRTYTGVYYRRISGFSYAREGLNGSVGHFYVLWARPPAHADPADDLTFYDEWDASAQDGNLPLIGGVDSIRITSGKRNLRKVIRRHLQGYVRPCLAHGDLNIGDPCIVHALEGD
jgi:hypothetical protein